MSKDEEKESLVMRQMFDEIIRLVREGQIKLEYVLSHAIERDMVNHDSFDRIFKIILDYGHKKNWIR